MKGQTSSMYIILIYCLTVAPHLYIVLCVHFHNFSFNQESSSKNLKQKTPNQIMLDF